MTFDSNSFPHLHINLNSDIQYPLFVAPFLRVAFDLVPSYPYPMVHTPKHQLSDEDSGSNDTPPRRSAHSNRDLDLSSKSDVSPALVTYRSDSAIDRERPRATQAHIDDRRTTRGTSRDDNIVNTSNTKTKVRAWLEWCCGYSHISELARYLRALC